MACPKRSAVDGLPEDSLVEILARLPARSICRSKCVAKRWHHMIEDPLHRKRLPQTLQGFFSIAKAIYSGVGHIGFANLRAGSAPLGIDPSLSFLTKLPGIETLTLADSCNGLLLFEHGQKQGPSDRLGYIVCNPATKHWGAVPRHDSLPPAYARSETRITYLVFDPDASFHFQVLQFRFMQLVTRGRYIDIDEQKYRISVHIYSSETGTWCHIESDRDEVLGKLERWRGQGLIPCRGPGCAVLNRVPHFIAGDGWSPYQIVAVDVQGTTRRIMPVPGMARWGPGYVAQSQGRLHYINKARDAQLIIWVLQGYDAQKWVLKHRVNFVELFGEKRVLDAKNEYQVVGMHPDGNVVFVVRDEKLISYDLDHKLASVIGTSKNYISAQHIVPYVPCFLELPALTNKL